MPAKVNVTVAYKIMGLTMEATDILLQVWIEDRAQKRILINYQFIV
jgi:hypothetical protein